MRITFNRFINFVASITGDLDLADLERVKEFTRIALTFFGNDVYQQGKIKRSRFLTRAPITAGTIAVTNGLSTATVTSGSLTSAVVGSQLCVGTERVSYEITGINVGTQVLTLERDYTGSTASGLSYQILLDRFRLAGDLRQLIWIDNEPVQDNPLKRKDKLRAFLRKWPYVIVSAIPESFVRIDDYEGTAFTSDTVKDALVVGDTSVESGTNDWTEKWPEKTAKVMVGDYLLIGNEGYQIKSADAVANLATGTIAVTNGLNTATVSGGSLTAAVKGRTITVGADAVSYTISDINVGTQVLTLSSVYAGVTGSGKTYVIASKNKVTLVEPIRAVVSAGTACEIHTVRPRIRFNVAPNSAYWTEYMYHPNTPSVGGLGEFLPVAPRYHIPLAYLVLYHLFLEKSDLDRMKEMERQYDLAMLKIAKITEADERYGWDQRDQYGSAGESAGGVFSRVNIPSGDVANPNSV